jgi:hypothetical protein
LNTNPYWPQLNLQDLGDNLEDEAPDNGNPHPLPGVNDNLQQGDDHMENLVNQQLVNPNPDMV